MTASRPVAVPVATVPAAAARPAGTALSKVVFVVGKPLAERDSERFGIVGMVDRRIDVTVLETGPIFAPHLGGDRGHYDRFSGFSLRVVASRAEFRAELPTLTDADLIICLVQNHGVSRANLPILRLITRSGTPYLIRNGPLAPGYWLNTFVQRFDNRVSKLWPLLRNKDYVDSLLVRLPPRWLGIRDADYVLQCSPGIRRSSPLIGPGTREIVGHAPDYEIFLRERAHAPAVRDQAVFIDQNLPFHHDFTDSRTRSVKPEQYYADLNRLFDHIEADLGLEVVIAAHPRADYSGASAVFGDRRVVASSTPRLVLESRLVLAHTSTAIGFAVMARKPVMLLISKAHYDVGIQGKACEAFAEALGVEVVFFGAADSIDLTRPLRVAAEEYDRYMATYVKAPGSPDDSLCKILIDQLNA